MNKHRPHHVSHKYMIAAKMSRAGYPRKAIAAHMGATVWQVNCYLNYAKRIGEKIDVEAGSMLLRQLPAPIIVWLRNQVPAGGSVDDVIRAVLTDAYHEDMEKLT
jgi:hypothetical protein